MRVSNLPYLSFLKTSQKDGGAGSFSRRALQAPGVWLWALRLVPRRWGKRGAPEAGWWPCWTRGSPLWSIRAVGSFSSDWRSRWPPDRGQSPRPSGSQAGGRAGSAWVGAKHVTGFLDAPPRSSWVASGAGLGALVRPSQAPSLVGVIATAAAGADSG